MPDLYTCTIKASMRSHHPACAFETVLNLCFCQVSWYAFHLPDCCLSEGTALAATLVEEGAALLDGVGVGAPLRSTTDALLDCIGCDVGAGMSEPSSMSVGGGVEDNVQQ